MEIESIFMCVCIFFWGGVICSLATSTVPHSMCAVQWGGDFPATELLHLQHFHELRMVFGTGSHLI